MRLRGILTGALVVGFAQLWLEGSAVADVSKGLYISGDVGVTRSPHQDFVGVPVTYDVGLTAGAQIGYAFGGPRVEIEYTYRYNNAHTIGSADGEVDAAGSLRASAVLANVIYDFDTGSKWVPYVGLGLGAANVQANTIRAAGSVSSGNFLDGGSTEFAAQAIVGVDFMTSEHVGLFLDFRGLWVKSPTMNYGTGCAGGATTACTTTGTTSYPYFNGAFNVGVRITF
jgi:OOP family OmpA-OmpF porin